MFWRQLVSPALLHNAKQASSLHRPMDVSGVTGDFRSNYDETIPFGVDLRVSNYSNHTSSLDAKIDGAMIYYAELRNTHRDRLQKNRTLPSFKSHR